MHSQDYAKVAADFWLLGFCECLLVLMPSRFYEAGWERTSGLRPPGPFARNFKRGIAQAGSGCGAGSLHEYEARGAERLGALPRLSH